jgi:hypothetical protein
MTQSHGLLPVLIYSEINNAEPLFVLMAYSLPNDMLGVLLLRAMKRCTI